MEWLLCMHQQVDAQNSSFSFWKGDEYRRAFADNRRNQSSFLFFNGRYVWLIWLWRCNHAQWWLNYWLHGESMVSDVEQPLDDWSMFYFTVDCGKCEDSSSHWEEVPHWRFHVDIPLIHRKCYLVLCWVLHSQRWGYVQEVWSQSLSCL